MNTSPSQCRRPDNSGGGNASFWFVITFMVIISAFGSFVNDMFSPALPVMKDYFRCSTSTVELGLTMGMVGLAVGQIFLGPMSDKYGRKPILIGSLILFTIAAVVSVFSPTIHFFLVCRLFQGLGASGGYFLARTIPADRYSGRQLARAMALIGAINGFAPASAPVLGGIISDRLGWQAIFVFLAVFAFLILCFSPKMHESLPPDRRTAGPIWKSFANYGLLLRNRPFMIHTIFKGTALGLLFAYLASAPFIMQRHFGYSQTSYGLIIGFNALFVVCGSMVALRFRILKKASLAGAVLLAVAIIPQAAALFFFRPPFWLYECLLLPGLFALGMIFTVTNTLAMNEGRVDAGAASAVIGVAGYVYGAILPPLVGIGNVLHSTAVVFAVLAVAILVLAVMAYRIPADLDK